MYQLAPSCNSVDRASYFALAVFNENRPAAGCCANLHRSIDVLAGATLRSERLRWSSVSIMADVNGEEITSGDPAGGLAGYQKAANGRLARAL
jgi:hypothetical protein